MGLGNITYGGNNVRFGADTDKPVSPNPADEYIAIDTGKKYVCYTSGEWESIAPTEPIGTIKMFSGHQSNIPPKWQVCDGTNGTPDLRNQFIVGAGDTYANGDTGGEAAHVLTVDEIPSHSHGISTLGTGGSKPRAESHVGASSIRQIENTGGDEPHNNLPPYYALYYIMKVIN